MSSDSRIASVIDAGKFAVTAAVMPPADADASALKEAAQGLSGTVHGVLVADGQGVRMSGLAACVHLAVEGVEPMLELSTRDMNRIALQSTLIGAASLGIKTVVCSPGLHQTLTDSRQARGVFDVDPIQLLVSAGELRNGAKMLTGTVTNPFSDPMELQVLGLRKAVTAGARLVITSPVFNIERFAAWMAMVREKGLADKVHIIAGVLPLQTDDEALELREKFRGTDIPDSVIGKIGLDFAAQTARDLAKIDGVRGIHIHYWADGLAEKVLEAAGIRAES